MLRFYTPNITNTFVQYINIVGYYSSCTYFISFDYITLQNKGTTNEFVWLEYISHGWKCNRVHINTNPECTDPLSTRICLGKFGFQVVTQDCMLMLPNKKKSWDLIQKPRQPYHNVTAMRVLAITQYPLGHGGDYEARAVCGLVFMSGFDAYKPVTCTCIRG